MRQTLLAAAALALLAGSPVIASAATTDATPTAAPASPAPGTLMRRLFNHQVYARNQSPKYGDPFDASQRRPDQVIVAPVGG